MGLPSNFVNKATREAIYRRDNYTCAYCGEKLDPKNRRQITLDHIVPRSKRPELASDVTNLITACHACNSKRQDKPIVEFLTKTLNCDHFDAVLIRGKINTQIMQSV